MTEPTQRSQLKGSRVELRSCNAWLNAFRAESDRAAVILGAAKLDLTLNQILAPKLLPATSGRANSKWIAAVLLRHGSKYARR